ncbi:MAG: alpha-L-arabinofuranosidase [Abditibacteriota bacterium]|nr:alpha-L-arabinofuranosidase [Abditibacteriota bacterium]
MKIVINADTGQHTINRHIYGHFAEHLGRCIYEGLWVGENSDIPNTRGIRNDVVEALKAIGIPNLRWPGGCFADEYHWQDGIGPREGRPSIVNTHWGGVTENNHFGTHEFLDLCGQLDCEPYICGNVGSGTVQELQQWVEYTTHPGGSPMADRRNANGRKEPWNVKYWGVGNENWGCGGNMRPEFYADEYRRYATYVRNFGENKVYKIACGPNANDYEWTEVLMRRAGGFMDGLSLHFYTIFPEWGNKGSATGFSETDWMATMQAGLQIEELLQRHIGIMDRYDPKKRVGLIVDEWGTWWRVEPDTNPGFLYQQNTLRDAMVAAFSLHAFHQYSDRIHMANIAQTINVLQAMVLTDGARTLKTPTYHVFEMFKVHHDATHLPLHHDFTIIEDTKVPHLHAAASRKGDTVNLSIANLHPHETSEVVCDVRGLNISGAKARILTSDILDAHNTFDEPNRIAPTEFVLDAPKDNQLRFTLPAKSVAVIALS